MIYGSNWLVSPSVGDWWNHTGPFPRRFEPLRWHVPSIPKIAIATIRPTLEQHRPKPMANVTSIQHNNIIINDAVPVLSATLTTTAALTKANWIERDEWAINYTSNNFKRVKFIFKTQIAGLCNISWPNKPRKKN